MYSRCGVLCAPLREAEAVTHQLPHPPTRAVRPIIPNNTRPSRLTAAAGTEFAGAIYASYGTILAHTQNFTTKTAFIIRAAWLDQACAQCPRFSTAAFQRSLGCVSVPMWPVILSNRLRIIGLVRFCHTNYLILRRLIIQRLCLLSADVPQLYGRFLRVPHQFATPPLAAFDLHVLNLPQAFILGQDHTHCIQSSIYTVVRASCTAFGLLTSQCDCLHVSHDHCTSKTHTQTQYTHDAYNLRLSCFVTL